jgi:hypothetical protein
MALPGSGILNEIYRARAKGNRIHGEFEQNLHGLECLYIRGRAESPIES